MTQRCLITRGCTLIAILAILTIPGIALGSGFAIYTQGASSLGQAAATIAHTEDPSAIFFNPALINGLDNTQIMIGTTLLFPSREFVSSFTGQSYKTESDVFFPSTFYLTHKVTDKLSVGLGVFNPFGLGTEWPANWEGRYIATNSKLQTYSINPVISYQAAPWLTVAGGVNILLLDTTLEKKLNFSYFGLPDGGQKFKGDGTGAGVNFGMVVTPYKDVTFGASYRSEVRMNIDGDATFSIPEIAQPVIGPLFPNTRGSASLTLPQQAHFGLHYKGLYPLTFEVAARWEGWSSFKSLDVVLDQPVAGSTIAVTERNWKDTWSWNVGLKYQLSESVALLAGYLYQGNPVPDSTFDPSIPDANGHLFCLGTDIRYKSFKFALAYGYQKLQDREKNNAVDDIPGDGITNPLTSANGKYKTDMHMIGLSLTYAF